VHADVVVLLTDIEGLFEADPRTKADARLIERVERLDDELAAAGGGPGSTAGSGGMATKLESARVLMRAGIPLVVCHGRRPGVLRSVVDGESVGTRFDAGRGATLRDRKLWLAYAGRPAGSVVIDDGASDALRLRGGSLLPAGVVDVTGSFVIGDPVTVSDAHGNVVARGLAGMSSEDLRKVKGMRTPDIASVLPDCARSEVVHRDHLVIL
ncbi:MAG TPA: glutamate 5-kinase, partial [Coriobacteriia bacterium]|nr:glutamate 5-kinase [Coriobacteriia bacterium]